MRSTRLAGVFIYHYLVFSIFLRGTKSSEAFFFLKCFTTITLLPAHARIALFLPLAFGSGLATRFHFVIWGTNRTEKGLNLVLLPQIFFLSCMENGLSKHDVMLFTDRQVFFFV